jgi:glycosyltransferase involved in cell wall biosynthesis
LHTSHSAAGLKVLHISQTLFGGGAETLARELVLLQRQKGLDAWLLCAYGERPEDRLRFEQADVVYYVNRLRLSRLGFFKELTRQIAVLAPDVVHTHTHVGSIWGRSAAIYARVPYIVHTEHSSALTLRLQERLVARILNRYTSVVVTFSRRNAALVRQRDHPLVLRIIPNGVRIRPEVTATDRRVARARLGLPGEQFVLGFVGNLYPHKRPDIPIRALSLLTPQSRGRILIAYFGDGPLKEELYHLVISEGVTENVRFYGFCLDIDAVFPALDAIITTSTREMMPMSLLEAMNASVPIIGTPHDGTLDLVEGGKTGIILQDWRPTTLAETLNKVIWEPELIQSLGANARAQVVAKYNIERVLDSYLCLYSTLTRRSGDLMTSDEGSLN